MGIIVRDVIDRQMTVYNPDGSILVVTHNMLTINDILIQIKNQELEGYKFQAERDEIVEISPNGRIQTRYEDVYSRQLKMLMGYETTHG